MRSVPGILRKRVIQPKYILAIVIILMLMMIGMGLYELSASRRDIMSVLHEEALSLAEAISIMSDNSLLCFYKIEDLISGRSLGNARILEWLDYEDRLSEEILTDIAERNGIYQIRVLDKGGGVVLNSHSQGNYIPPDPRLVNGILDGTEDETVIRPDGDGLYAIGIRRRKGGAIILNLGSSEIINSRKSLGIGRLIQDIGGNKGIEYIVLQDENGLILASENVTKMRKITGDNFLESALQNRWLDTREYSFNGKDVLEVVSPFQIDDTVILRASAELRRGSSQRPIWCCRLPKFRRCRWRWHLRRSAVRTTQRPKWQRQNASRQIRP